MIERIALRRIELSHYFSLRNKQMLLSYDVHQILRSSKG